jgi:hypothetical protein
MRGILDRLDRLVAARCVRFRITYGYSIVVLDPAVFGEAILISSTELALDNCAILNRLLVNDMRVKKVAEGLRMTFRRGEINDSDIVRVIVRLCGCRRVDQGCH